MLEMSAEEHIHESLLAIADIGRDYVEGVECKDRMKAQLDKLEEGWAMLAEEIISGGNRG